MALTVANIVVVKGKNVGKAYTLNDTTMLGRHGLADVIISESSISRYHAKITRSDQGYIIEDLDSVNGTYVGGKRIKKALLKDGDHIQIGWHEFVFSEYVPQDDDSGVTTSREEGETGRTIMFSAWDDDRDNIVDESSSYNLTKQQIGTICRRLKTINAVSKTIGSKLSFPVLLEEIVTNLFNAFPQADRGAILLKDEEGGKDLIPLAFKRKQGADDYEREEGITISTTAIKQAMNEKMSILSYDASDDSRFENAESIVRYGIHSMMCVPLICQDEVLGIIHIVSFGLSTFNEDDLELLTGIANQVAISLKNARLFQELENKNQVIMNAYEQLVKSEKLASLGQLAASVAHEIKNPLTVISGSAQMIGRLKERADKIETYSQSIEEQTEHISRIVEQLLSFSRQGTIELNYEDINEVIEDTLVITQHHLSRFKGVDVHEDLARKLPRVSINEGQIQQVFVNMIMNAVQAMPDGGTLFISTGVEELPPDSSDDGTKISDAPHEFRPFVAIKFRDTGVGISEENREKIFEAFFTTKIEKGGTGLGLSICSEIIDRHGGQIGVESEVGKGTTFTIYIPVPAAQEQQEFQDEAVGKGERTQPLRGQEYVQ